MMYQHSNQDQQNDRPAHEKGSALTNRIGVALLTGGGDRPYAYGLARELVSKAIALDVIGSDELDCPEFRQPRMNFLNLRGNVLPNASFAAKVSRVLLYYFKLIRYAATAKPRVFHILWNNKFQLFDRTILMLYYRLLGKKIVLTLHNVNAAKRDSKDTILNRLTLRIQYRLADHIFVHTEKMKLELIQEFGVRKVPITVIPFGINNAVSNTDLTTDEAKQRLGIRKTQRTLLFFGNITPYKGLEYLVSAFQQLLTQCDDYRLLIAGSPKGCDKYWDQICETIAADVRRGRILVRAEFIPDNDTEVYFKAADVLVLPYRQIYQSGVLFLGYCFGLPVLAADVGSLKDEIAEGKSGFVFKPEDPRDLARVIERYFSSEIYADLNSRRQEIRNYGKAQHSWDLVGHMTMGVYADLLRIPFIKAAHTDEISSSSFDVNPIDQVVHDRT